MNYEWYTTDPSICTAGKWIVTECWRSCFVCALIRLIMSELKNNLTEKRRKCSVFTARHFLCFESVLSWATIHIVYKRNFLHRLITQFRHAIIFSLFNYLNKRYFCTFQRQYFVPLFKFEVDQVLIKIKKYIAQSDEIRWTAPEPQHSSCHFIHDQWYLP